MLTRDLLRYRVRRGEVQPRFIDPADAELMAHAGALVAHVKAAAANHAARGAVDEALASCVHADIDLQVARGLRKLVTDMCRFAEPDANAPALRAACFTQGTATLRALPLEATRADFAAQLAQICGDTTQLYNDLPQERRLLDVKPCDASELLQRYNMAQVQGLAMAGKSLHIRTPAGDVRAVRRVLRWLKFCRLVARVQKAADGTWDMHITGPAEMFAHAKKYGLQLAMFLPVVPVLEAFTLEAEVALRPGLSWRLLLTQDAPLVSPHQKRLGVAPSELQHIVKTFTDTHWQLDTKPPPRAVGPHDMMLPDFTCVHSAGSKVHVELFHRWHRHALAARLRQLQERPDGDILLGIDKSLGLPDTPIQTFVFNTFPTAKKLRECLRAWDPA